MVALRRWEVASGIGTIQPPPRPDVNPAGRGRAAQNDADLGTTL